MIKKIISSLMCLLNKKLGPIQAIVISLLIMASSVILFLYSCNVNDSGYSNCIDHIFDTFGVKPFSLKLNTVGDLYFQRIGFLSNWELTILGQFSQETMSKILDTPLILGLPSPKISYQDEQPVQNEIFYLLMPPTDVVNKLLLFKKSPDRFSSKIDDNLIVFRMSNENYLISLYLLGRTGFFVLKIMHNVRD